jgi:hypothetical protein
MGLTCSDQGVCVDGQKLLPQATVLKQDTVASIGKNVGTLASVLLILNCSSAICEKSLGFTNQGGYMVDSFGIVAGPREWSPHFVRHELIHYLQATRCGSLST